MPFDYPFSFHVAVLLPQSLDWFGLFQFRSPLLSESLLFSFPPGTKMFQFPGFSSLKLCIGLRIAPHYWYWVAPFGYPRIVAYLRLPEAFRCYSRPSSALYAKTSTIRSSSFNHYFLTRFIIVSLYWELLTVSSFQIQLIFSLQLFRKTYLSFFCYSVFKEHFLRMFYHPFSFEKSHSLEFDLSKPNRNFNLFLNVLFVHLSP